MVEPYQCDVSATAFRETNIGNEKELDNSVLWKAVQALGSLIGSLKRESIEGRFEEAELGVTSARLQGDDDTEFLEDLVGAVRDLSLFHPVVVIDAPLWVVRGEQLFAIPICRFEQLQAAVGFSRWVDVVHRPHFDGFVLDLTRYYENAFKKVRARHP